MSTRDGERELTMMRWGFPPPPNLGTRPVTNVRNLSSSYWRGWLKPEWRCLVPATSFCEYTDSQPKVPHWFALAEDRPLFAFAGIWRPWTGTRGTKAEPVGGRAPPVRLPDLRGQRRGAADPRQGDAGAADHARSLRRLADGSVEEAIAMQRRCRPSCSRSSRPARARTKAACSPPEPNQFEQLNGVARCVNWEID